jgi:hypothetical protein
MKRMKRGARILLVALTPLALACATSRDVRFEASDDLSGDPTWSWAPRNEPSVIARHRDYTEIERHVERVIAQILSERGFRRSHGPADFYASYHLGLRRRDLAVVVPFATRTVSSYHHSGSFVVEGSERTVRRFEDAYLVIGFARRGEPFAWHAALQQRVEGSFDDELDVAIARVLADFPYHVPPDEPRGQPEQSPCLLAQPPRERPGADPGSPPGDLASHTPHLAADGAPESCPRG